MTPYPNQSIPLTISMWDYTWLLCGHRGGSFHDLPRRMEEAAQRGYNTLPQRLTPRLWGKANGGAIELVRDHRSHGGAQAFVETRGDHVDGEDLASRAAEEIAGMRVEDAEAVGLAKEQRFAARLDETERGEKSRNSSGLGRSPTTSGCPVTRRAKRSSITIPSTR